jgi:hypothetical protein
MSSLAGALEEPVRYNHSYSSALSSATHDQDVDMEMPEVKEEPNPIPAQVVIHRDGGDEAMDDLFGQEAEVDEPRQVKSETCAFVPPRNTIPLCSYYAYTGALPLHLQSQGMILMNFRKRKKNAEGRWSIRKTTNRPPSW